MPHGQKRASLSKVICAHPAVQMAPQLTSSYFQPEDVVGQVHFHNDHQIPFHLEVEGEKDETETPCRCAQTPY